jgi:hypothetical protein
MFVETERDPQAIQGLAKPRSFILSRDNTLVTFMQNSLATNRRSPNNLVVRKGGKWETPTLGRSGVTPIITLESQLHRSRNGFVGARVSGRRFMSFVVGVLCMSC